MSLLADSPIPAGSADSSHAGASARPPAALLISIGGAMAVLALAAAWLWIERGAAILLDIGQIFCF
jgi:hypothetical protein